MSIRDSMSIKHWRRYPAQGWVAGVCVGLADYFGWNVKLVRVLFVLGLLFSGFFPVGLAYCVLWYLMDEGEQHPQDHAAGSDFTAYATPTGTTASPADIKARFARLEERLGSMEESVTSREFELRRELKKLEG